jgi:hypothetical protein
MCDECLGVGRAHGWQRVGDPSEQTRHCPLGQLPQNGFYLRDCVLDRIEIRRIRRQPQHTAACGLDQFVNPPVVMCGKIVQHQHPTSAQNRDQFVAEELNEFRGCGATIKTGRRDDALGRQRRDGADGFEMTVGHAADHSLARRGAAVGPLHLGIGAEFVEKNQIDDSRAREPAEPGGAFGYDVGAIPLRGMRGLFFRGNFNR